MNVREYVERDCGDAPGSRYGVKARDWQPIAIALANIMLRETGEPHTEESLDHLVGLVVNDHDDVAYTLETYGTDAERELLEA